MKYFLLLIILSCGHSLHAQQAWTQKKGEAYFQVGGSLLNYSALHYYTSSAIEIPRPITELTLSAYAEYGILDNLTAAVNVPYHLISSGELATDWNGFAPEKGELAALGNVNLGFTYKMYDKKRVVVSSKLGFGINSSTAQQSTGLRTGYDAYTVAPSVLAGIGTSKFFASAEAGMNFMTNGYLHRFVFNAQIGKHFLKSKRMLFVVAVSTITAVGKSSEDDNLNLDGNARFTGLYMNNQSFYAVNFKLGYELTRHWTIWTALAGGMANNIGRGAVFSLTIAYQLKKKDSTD